MTRGASAVEAAVAATGLLVPERPLLVMYSGGRDSTCLLDLAVRRNGAAAVSALHVNYGLRPGAVLDERHCVAVCERLGVPLAIVRPPGPARSGNLQAWAREVRYGAAAEHADGAEIAAGHTADDQLETILYRLIAAPSRRALLGMAPRAGGLIRPLLGVSRAETGGYCAERQLPYRDDETNASGAYVRNRIRNELIPLLSELHPGAEANVLALAAVLREEQELLDAQVTTVIAGRAALPLAELRGLPRALSRLVIQRLSDGVHGSPAAGIARRLDDVLAMAPDAILDLPGGVRAVSADGVLRWERTPPLRR